MNVQDERGYLLLGRSPGQSIVIGDDIFIKIFDVNGRFVRVGINAPKDILVLRDEIYKKEVARRDARREVLQRGEGLVVRRDAFESFFEFTNFEI